MERHLSTDSAVLFINLITKNVMKTKKRIHFSLLLSLISVICLAMPAKRIKRSLTLADGTTVMATLVGDENGHWYVDDMGKALSEDNTVTTA